MRSMPPAPKSSASISCSFAPRRPTTRSMLIAAIRRAKAKVVLAAADERLGLSQPQIDQQLGFFAQTGRPAGYVNLATERDWVVRFKAQPAPAARRLPQELCRAAGGGAGHPGRRGGLRRIAWLREPARRLRRVPHHPRRDAAGRRRRAAGQGRAKGLKDKIVILGGAVSRYRPAPDADDLRARMSGCTGAVVHAHIVARRSTAAASASSRSIRWCCGWPSPSLPASAS